MTDLSTDRIAEALAAVAARPASIREMTVELAHGGIDGYERDTQLVRFVYDLRTAGMASAHMASWPKPEAVLRAEVSIVAHGTERCGAKTVAAIAAFVSKHIAVTAEFGEPVKVKSGRPRLEITVRAIEVVELEDPGDRAARLGREMVAPSMRGDGTYENELRPGETPAFVHGQGIAEIDPLADRLERMERAAHIPGPEDDADPKSVIQAEDPEAVVDGWRGLMKKDVQITGGGSGGRSMPKSFSNATCECGHRADRHGEFGACKECACERFMLPEKKSTAKVPFRVRVSATAREVLTLDPAGAAEALEQHAKAVLASTE